MCTMNPKLTSGQRLMAESQHMGVEVKVAADKLDRLEAQNAKLRDFIELLLSCPRDSGECKECRRLNGLCAVELNAVKLGIEVE